MDVAKSLISGMYFVSIVLIIDVKYFFLLMIFIDSFDDTLQILKEKLMENYDYFR